MRNDASEAQVAAAAPGVSTWLSASAGSGKTRVLIDRVARLLLQGTPPQRILCLTYTNAAASEMQNRLFRRLGEWAMKPEADLALALQDLGVEGAADLAEARRLFARAIETPGGLRIQTIHSFCASLLRRFPLEAGVAPQFTEIDDRTLEQLIREVLEDMASGQGLDLVSRLGRVFGEHGFLAAVKRVTALRRTLRPRSLDEIRSALGLRGEVSGEALIAETFRDLDPAYWAAALARLSASSVKDQQLAGKLAAVNLASPGLGDLLALEDALLTKTGPRQGLASEQAPTQSLRKADPALLEPLLDLAERVAGLRPRRLALLAAEEAATLSDFAQDFLPRFAEAKSRRGWLDFDDLIEKAESLLTDTSVAAWVLFRLDGGIDHILVDEAQDTSPAQWRVIELLTQEFTAGLGARGRGRTLFVVGDKKQSIYSFQGADVSGFDARNGQFRRAFEVVGLSFQNRELLHSFRSSPLVLSVVDAVFGSRFPKAMGSDVRHIAFHDGLPGRVELWPTVPKADNKDESADWTDPVDQVSPQAPRVVLARQIAAHIRDMLAIGAAVPLGQGRSRPVRPGDFLILVRRRSGVFPHLIRACKAAGLPVAGADRLKLAEELAVMDLLALLTVLAMPEDDLSLAAVLRSPLCGWSEAQLFALAHGRPGYLWEALRQTKSAALEMISDLRDQADFLRPHDLLDRILTRHRGRVRLLARLGDEVEESIDALLAQALAYEQIEVPSLDGFLGWMQGGDSTIKRQMGEGADRIRIMTVHGAKGLESEIVILPDSGDRRSPSDKSILLDSEGLPFASGNKGEQVDLVASLVAARQAKEEDEALRLLYVALTRARTQLIVAAAGDAGPDSWHGRVQAAMTELGALSEPGDRLLLQSADWPRALGRDVALAGPPVPASLPDWAESRADSPKPARRPLTPSALGGAKTMAGTDVDDDATARGTALHLLLQHLPGQPQAHWPILAVGLVPEAALRAELLPLAARLIGNPDLAPLFGPDSLAEVSIAGQVFGQPAEGSIDRLVVLATGILAVDYKTNRRVPLHPQDCPEAILRQMGAYAALLAAAYPGRTIATAVLWTETGQLMPLDDDIVRAALLRATKDGGLPLDGGAPRP